MPEDNDNLLPVTEEDLLLRPFVHLDAPDEDELKEVPAGGDALSTFDRRYREPFTGLMYLGHLKEKVHLFGHTFDLQTPSYNEKLEAGLLHKPYLNTISSEIAWAAITVSMYLRSVDGTPLPEPIGPKDSGLRDRLDWIVDNLRGQVISSLFTSCLALDAKVDSVLEELSKAGEA